MKTNRNSKQTGLLFKPLPDKVNIALFSGLMLACINPLIPIGIAAIAITAAAISGETGEEHSK